MSWTCLVYTVYTVKYAISVSQQPKLKRRKISIDKRSKFTLCENILLRVHNPIFTVTKSGCWHFNTFYILSTPTKSRQVSNKSHNTSFTNVCLGGFVKQEPYRPQKCIGYSTVQYIHCAVKLHNVRSFWNTCTFEFLQLPIKLDKQL